MSHQTESTNILTSPGDSVIVMRLPKCFGVNEFETNIRPLVFLVLIENYLFSSGQGQVDYSAAWAAYYQQYYQQQAAAAAAGKFISSQ